MLRHTQLTVDLSAIAHNTRSLAALPGGALMAVVKADGYGHGAVEVSRTALASGASWLGVALVEEQPFLVEIGILLDVFAAVFIMGIAIFHINREFDHIDTDKLSNLRT